MLRITDQVKEYYQATDLFDRPRISVTQGQCDRHAGAGHCGYECRILCLPGEGLSACGGTASRVCLRGLFHDDEGLIAHSSASFFDGLVSNSDGRVPEGNGAGSYIDENGDLVYTISIFADASSLIGRTMKVTLTDLGVYTDKQANHEVQALGTWAFEWTLKGSDHHWDFSYLALDVGNTGATVAHVHPSPIHAKQTMNVELTLLEYRNRADGKDLIPHFYGVKMKDDTMYESITEAGMEGYTSPDPGEKVYQLMYAFSRVIEPTKVDYLLFSCPNETGEHDIIEVKFN